MWAHLPVFPRAQNGYKRLQADSGSIRLVLRRIFGAQTIMEGSICSFPGFRSDCYMFDTSSERFAVPKMPIPSQNRPCHEMVATPLTLTAAAPCLRHHRKDTSTAMQLKPAARSGVELKIIQECPPLILLVRIDRHMHQKLHLHMPSYAHSFWA